MMGCGWEFCRNIISKYGLHADRMVWWACRRTKKTKLGWQTSPRMVVQNLNSTPWRFLRRRPTWRHKGLPAAAVTSVPPSSCSDGYSSADNIAGPYCLGQWLWFWWENGSRLGRVHGMRPKKEFYRNENVFANRIIVKIILWRILWFPLTFPVPILPYS